MRPTRRVLRYSRNQSNRRGFDKMSLAELEQHPGELVARRAECIRLRDDTRGMTQHQAGRVVAEMGRELKALAMAIQSAESVLATRRKPRRKPA